MEGLPKIRSKHFFIIFPYDCFENVMVDELLPITVSLFNNGLRFR